MNGRVVCFDKADDLFVIGFGVLLRTPLHHLQRHTSPARPAAALLAALPAPTAMFNNMVDHRLSLRTWGLGENTKNCCEKFAFTFRALLAREREASSPRGDRPLERGGGGTREEKDVSGGLPYPHLAPTSPHRAGGSAPPTTSLTGQAPPRGREDPPMGQWVEIPHVPGPPNP